MKSREQTMAHDAGQRDEHESAARSVCSCTHPTHFLGRCQAAVNPPEELCAECMQNHFHRIDDPAI
jgi:hypothetical protein